MKCFQDFFDAPGEDGAEWPQPQPEPADYPEGWAAWGEVFALAAYSGHDAQQLPSVQWAFQFCLIVPCKIIALPVAVVHPMEYQQTFFPSVEHDIPPTRAFLGRDGGQKHLIPPRNEKGEHAASLGSD